MKFELYPMRWFIQKKCSAQENDAICETTIDLTQKQPWPIKNTVTQGYERI